MHRACNEALCPRMLRHSGSPVGSCPPQAVQEQQDQG
jgi:hypothetical protein